MDSTPMALFSSFVGTNYSASDPEISMIKEWCQENQRTVDALSSDLEDLQKVVRDRLSQRAEMQKSIDLYAALVSPIRRLQPEILSQIFVWTLPITRPCVMTSKEMPLILGRVCSRWRKIAQSTRELWANIHITIPPPGHRELGKRRIAALGEWLDRAGPVTPLTLSLSQNVRPGRMATGISQYVTPAVMALGAAIIPSSVTDNQSDSGSGTEAENAEDVPTAVHVTQTADPSNSDQGVAAQPANPQAVAVGPGGGASHDLPPGVFGPNFIKQLRDIAASGGYTGEAMPIQIIPPPPGFGGPGGGGLWGVTAGALFGGGGGAGAPPGPGGGAPVAAPAGPGGGAQPAAVGGQVGGALPAIAPAVPGAGQVGAAQNAPQHQHQGFGGHGGGLNPQFLNLAAQAAALIANGFQMAAPGAVGGLGGAPAPGGGAGGAWPPIPQNPAGGAATGGWQQFGGNPGVPPPGQAPPGAPQPAGPQFPMNFGGPALFQVQIPAAPPAGAPGAPNVPLLPMGGLGTFVLPGAQVGGPQFNPVIAQPGPNPPPGGHHQGVPPSEDNPLGLTPREAGELLEQLEHDELVIRALALMLQRHSRWRSLSLSISRRFIHLISTLTDLPRMRTFNYSCVQKHDSPVPNQTDSELFAFAGHAQIQKLNLASLPSLPAVLVSSSSLKELSVTFSARSFVAAHGRWDDAAKLLRTIATCQNLETLAIDYLPPYVPPDPAVLPLSMITMPKLKCISIRTSEDHSDATYILSHLVCPSLTSLQANATHTMGHGSMGWEFEINLAPHYTAVAEFVRRSGCKLKSLIIDPDRFCPMPDTLLDVLKACGELEELLCNLMDHGMANLTGQESVYKQLDVDILNLGTSLELLPNLKTFIMEGPIKWDLPTVRGFVAARAARGLKRAHFVQSMHPYHACMTTKQVDIKDAELEKLVRENPGLELKIVGAKMSRRPKMDGTSVWDGVPREQGSFSTLDEMLSTDLNEHPAQPLFVPGFYAEDDSEDGSEDDDDDF